MCHDVMMSCPDFEPGTPQMQATKAIGEGITAIPCPYEGLYKTKNIECVVLVAFLFVRYYF